MAFGLPFTMQRGSRYKSLSYLRVTLSVIARKKGSHLMTRLPVS